MPIRSTHYGVVISNLERDLEEPTPIGDVFSRLRSHGAYTRLEPDDGKLSRPVLRGGSGSNAASLPDRRDSLSFV
jgi:hypothetical protein